jgi:hypothetical protein
MVGDSAKSEGCTVLDGDCGIEEERPELFEDSQRVQVLDVLRFRSKVGYLLRKFDLRFLELLECVLKGLHPELQNYILISSMIKLQSSGDSDQKKASDQGSSRLFLNKNRGIELLEI